MSEPKQVSSYKHPSDAWYLRAAWLRRRNLHLKHFPLCVFCLEDGRVEVATEVDHVEPHRGDYNRFRLGKLQSLCATHHQGHKKRMENRGYSNAIGIDGVPLDQKHPIFRGRA
jgi:hypothetical protein